MSSQSLSPHSRLWRSYAGTLSRLVRAPSLMQSYLLLGVAQEDYFVKDGSWVASPEMVVV